VFILDPNGVQVDGPKWWHKYTRIFFKNTGKKISNVEMVEHFFNEQIVQVLIEQINKNYPNEYEITFDTKINLNAYNINVVGSAYQEDGYCMLISFFFIHLVYNNITIHNRDIFSTITDHKIIVQYLKELMIFIHKLINTPPFTNQQFFYNYSINIFRFMLSTKNVENHYNINSLVNTYKTVRKFFTYNPDEKSLFPTLQTANVMSIYMKIIIGGMGCIPSMIGVPKLNIPNYNQMLNQRDFSCIRFYTPFRKLNDLKDQPLRLWFADDEEQVIFIEDNICMYKIHENSNRSNPPCINKPHFVLLDISKVLAFLNDSNNYNSFIKDYKIMSPRDIHITHTNLDNNSTSDKKSCVIS